MSKTKERIRDSQLRYQQGLGQNFIYDEDLLETIARLSGVSREDDVLEVGPGVGTLTRHLCQLAGRVRSVELDSRLIPLLRAFLQEEKNFSLIEGDILKLDLAEATADFRRPFSVVANIPYYITTPLITRLLTAELPLRRLALMVQREVADKILAQPGDEGWGPLALRCQYRTEPRLALEVPARCFTPPPKVDSAFVVMPLRERPAVAVRCEADFFRVAQAGFALRRKTMTNGLIAAFHMEREEALRLMAEAGLDEKVRGEALSMEELARLSDAYTAFREEHA